MSRVGTPTDNPITDLIGGWEKKNRGRWKQAKSKYLSAIIIILERSVNFS